MKHLGDITKLDGHNVPLVDIVTGGSPCQDLSVAGKRAGLAGERSGLFMEQIRIIKEMRDESAKQLRSRGTAFDIRYIQPRYMVWENVPGAFSSNKGEDFRAVLEETAKVCDKDAVIPRPENGKWTPSGVILGDGWSIAWRVHDAQFWGVPQRRKRIALVADFGGQSAPEILFEFEGLSGDSETSREEGQKIAGTVGENIDKAISFQERAGKPGGAKEYSYNMSEQEPCQHSTTKVYCLQGNGIDRADTAGCNGRGWREDQSYTLNTIDRPAVCTYQQTTGALCASGYDKLGIQEAANDMYVVQSNWDGSQISPTLTSKNAGGGQRMPDKENFNAVITFTPDSEVKNAIDEIAFSMLSRDYKDPQCVCYGLDRASFNQGQNAQYDFSIEEETAQTLVSRGPGGVLSRQSVPYVQETTKE